MSAETRRSIILEFREGLYRVIFVRDLFNEGIDFPEVEALLFIRPTESEIVFTQQLGRGLRLNPNKTGVLVLDFIGNYINAGRIFEYLSSYGTDVTLDAARKKPVFYYDNGCEVTFDHSTVETL